jgi:hypothetical protein
VEGAVEQVWPSGAGAPQLSPNIQAGDALFFALQALSPQSDLQRSLKSQAAGIALELGQLRTQLVVQSISSISAPLLIVVVCWLVILFISFSLLAPSNSTATLALAVAAISVAGAMFLILELDRPFSGLVRIPSEPVQAALSQPAK